MPKERYYIPNPYALKDRIYLEGTEFHHLTHVMRSTTGQSVEIVNGMGDLAEAVISQLEKKRALLEIIALKRLEEPCNAPILVQAIPRMNRLDFIVEKGTELGMRELWLFAGEKSERKSLAETALERLRLIAIAAMKQCGRLYLPKIVVIPAIEKWEECKKSFYFGSFAENASPLLKARQNNISETAHFCVGPEAGLSNKEEEKLLMLGAVGVTLHKNILRTDTAAITALALLSHS